MKPPFSFLKSYHVQEEIKIHKWIESEKLGYEIGYATAALDWIKKYGLSWKRYYLGENIVE